MAGVRRRQARARALQVDCFNRLNEVMRQRGLVAEVRARAGVVVVVYLCVCVCVCVCLWLWVRGCVCGVEALASLRTA